MKRIEIRIRSTCAALTIGTVSTQSRAIADVECRPAWSHVGSGIAAPTQSEGVFAMAVYDDGGGEALYAAGDFGAAGNVPAHRIAKWDGRSWSPVVEGLPTVVNALAVYDHGDGPKLYAGGSSPTDGASGTAMLAEWDGKSWRMLDVEFETHPRDEAIVWGLGVADLGDGPELYVGGRFDLANGIPAHGVIRWNGSRWAALGAGVANGPYPSVWCFAPYCVGGRSVVAVGGDFRRAGDAPAANVALWDGAAWTPLGAQQFLASSVIPAVNTIAVFDDGTGISLYAGGALVIGGPQIIRGVSRWDGIAWQPVGAGLTTTANFAFVSQLAVCDVGEGAALHAVGTFTRSRDEKVRRVARWHADTGHWMPLGDGVGRPDADGDPLSGPYAAAVVAFDDGSSLGPSLFVGGRFDEASSTPVRNIARWGCRLGDLNCDGRFDNFDVDPFVSALTDANGYSAEFPACNLKLGDFDRDGAVTNLDVGLFADALGRQ